MCLFFVFGPCFVVLGVLSSLAIILLSKRDLVALFHLCCSCASFCLFLLVPGLGLQSAIVSPDCGIYQSPIILTELFQHNLINVSYLTTCYLYQVMMTLHLLNVVANDAESTKKNRKLHHNR